MTEKQCEVEDYQEIIMFQVMSKKEEPKSKTIIENRKARFEYFILEVMEAGIALTGSEVKSLRAGRGAMADAFGQVRKGEIWLVNLNIQQYKQANKMNHEPTRARKLLLHGNQINKFIGKMKEKGLTLIPLSLYFNKRGFVKVELALCKGKAVHDKRESIKKRDWDRQKTRLLRGD